MQTDSDTMLIYVEPQDCLSKRVFVERGIIQHIYLFMDRVRTDVGYTNINYVVSLCKANKKIVMIFKVDFDEAYDSICLDFLDDILG